MAQRPVVVERLEVECTLVPESGVEARPIHAGRRRQVVEGRARIAGLPEDIDRALEGGLRIISTRTPASLPSWARIRRCRFLYHFAKNP
jgi:hypothetical protein